MAGSVNKAIIIGNLGQDPESRTSTAGDTIVNLSVATSESWKDKATGEKRERTEWHRVVIFNEPLGEIAMRYLKKGMKVYLEGEIRTRKWQDQSGQDRYSTEIVLARYRGELQMLERTGGIKQAQSEDDYGQTRSAQSGAAGGTAPEMDDEIPF